MTVGQIEWGSLLRQVKRSVGRARFKQIDYYLFLHDDLQFNRWLRYNVCSWLRLHSRERLLASLVNSGIRSEACDVHNYAYLASPGAAHSSPAFTISAALLARITGAEKTRLRAGDERPILSQLSDALNQPVAYHCPSLVQVRDTIRSGFGQLAPAVDYEPWWKRPRARNGHVALNG
jgi:hypothetical protein